MNVRVVHLAALSEAATPSVPTRPAERAAADLPTQAPEWTAAPDLGLEQHSRILAAVRDAGPGGTASLPASA